MCGDGEVEVVKILSEKAEGKGADSLERETSVPSWFGEVLETDPCKHWTFSLGVWRWHRTSDIE
jgi:hypothetical protein